MSGREVELAVVPSPARDSDNPAYARAPGQLRVLTQNMFAHYFIRGCADKDDRSRGLIRCLKAVANDVDVVLLQELFVGKIGSRDLGGQIVQEVVAAARELGFLYHAGGKDPKQLLLGQNNGLIILSRFKFVEDPVDITFNNRAETVCAKGVLKVVLDVDGARVHVITSHLDSRGSDTKRLQLMEVRSAFPPLVEADGSPANIILTGDLNVDALRYRGGKHDYEMLLNILAPAGEVVDVWAGAHLVTCEEDKAHLDYIFASPHMLPQNFRDTRRVEYLTTDGLSDASAKNVISDHWGLSCTFFAHGAHDPTPEAEDEIALEAQQFSATAAAADCASEAEDRKRALEDMHMQRSTLGVMCPAVHHIPMSMHSIESPFLPATVSSEPLTESVWAWRDRAIYHCLDRDSWRCTCLLFHRERLYAVGRSLRRWDLTTGRELPSKTVSSMLSSCKACVPLMRESRLAPPSAPPTEPESLVVLVATNSLHKMDVISLQSSDTSSGGLRARLANSSWQFTNALVETKYGEVFAFTKRLYHVRNVEKGDAATVGRNSFSNVCEAIMVPTPAPNDDEEAGERCIVSTDKGSLLEVDLTSGDTTLLLNLDDARSSMRGLFYLQEPGEAAATLFGFTMYWLYRVRWVRGRASLTKICHNSFAQPRAVVVDRGYFARTGRHRVFLATDIGLASLVLPADCLSDASSRDD